MELHNVRIQMEHALDIERADAERMYGDLSNFRIAVQLHPDGWHITFDVEPADDQGGGPHYVIDPVDGTITRKRYYQ